MVYLLLLEFLIIADAPIGYAKTATASLEKFISAEEATQKATRQAKLGPLYSAGEVKLAYDSQGRPWYIVNFLLTEPSHQKSVLGKRIVLNPGTGNKVQDELVLKEMDAWISREEAARSAFHLFELENDYKMSEARFNYDESSENIWHSVELSPLNETLPHKRLDTLPIYDSQGRAWYVVSLLRTNPENPGESFFEKKIVLSVHEGQKTTHEAVLKEFFARETDIPPDVDPLTRKVMDAIPPPSSKMPLTKNRWLLMALLGTGVGLFLAGMRKLKKMKWAVNYYDLIFGSAVVVQFTLAIFLLSDHFLAIFLLTSAIGTLTSWAMMKASGTPGGNTDWKISKRQKMPLRKLTWSDLIVPQEVLADLKRLARLIEHPEVTSQLGIDPPKGVLLYGPPGTGKTTIAKVIADEVKASFYCISQADIFAKWMGETEHHIQKIFEEARNNLPSIIFIDEIEALMSKRGSHESGFWADKAVSQILQEIDGMQDSSHLFVIGATNMPDQVDPALLRGGRLSTQIEIPLPGRPEREKLFSLYLKTVKKAEDVRIPELMDLSEDLSGADIKEICQRTILEIFEAGQNKTLVVQQKDLITAIQKYQKSSRVYRVPDYFKHQN